MWAICCRGAANITKMLVHGVVNGALRVAQGGSFLNGFTNRVVGSYSVARTAGGHVKFT